MNMPNRYYNQGRRRGNQPGGMPYQTPMGGPGMGGSIPTFPNSMPMGGAGVGNNPLHPTPMGAPNINRNPDFGNWPGNMQSPTTIPGGPLQESPLQAPNFPDRNPWPPMQGSPGMGGGPEMPSPRPDLFPPTTGPTGGTRIPGGPLQESPLQAPDFPGRRGPVMPPPEWEEKFGGGPKPQGMLPPPPPSQRGNNQGGGGVLPFGHGRNVGSGPAPGPGTDASMPAQKSYSSSYNPNTNRNRNTTNRYSTGGNMNANRMRGGYRGASGSGGYPGQVSGRYQTPRGGGSYDTGGLYSPGSGGRREVSYFPRSPGMPNVTNTSNTYNNRSRNYDQRRTYNTQNTQTFNEGDTSTTQGPRIAKTMGRMQGYNPMMHGSQSRQIGGLRNLQRMLAAMRGGRR